MTRHEARWVGALMHVQYAQYAAVADALSRALVRHVYGGLTDDDLRGRADGPPAFTIAELEEFTAEVLRDTAREHHEKAGEALARAVEDETTEFRPESEVAEEADFVVVERD